MSATIAETKSWSIGPYRVQQRPRFDNPAWAVYVVMRGEDLIGKTFSIPSLSDCQWLERNGGEYSKTTRPSRRYSHGRPIWNSKAEPEPA